MIHKTVGIAERLTFRMMVQVNVDVINNDHILAPPTRGGEDAGVYQNETSSEFNMASDLSILFCTAAGYEHKGNL